jgi:hypothetical protein
MVYCSIASDDFSDPEKLKSILLHLVTATAIVLENFIRKFGEEEQLVSLQTDFPRLQPNEYRRRLIDIYVNKLFILGDIKNVEKENRARYIVEGRVDKSIELKKLLKNDPWECPICLENYEDPENIYVTCHTDENANRDKEASTEVDSDKTVKKEYYCQHKACDKCSRNLRKCHICRSDAERIPLSKIWNGSPVKMMMGGNPFLVDLSQ